MPQPSVILGISATPIKKPNDFWLRTLPSGCMPLNILIVTDQSSCTTSSIKNRKGDYAPLHLSYAILAYQHLRRSIELYGYALITEIVGIWKHNKRPTIFCLCIDDFCTKYWSKSHTKYLCNSVRSNFRCIVDKEGKNYFGLMLN